MTDVVIAGGSEETRLLLKGLVRLHHHRVVAEGPGPDILRDLPPEVDAPIALLDVDLDQVEWSDEIAATIRRLPRARIVLLTPNRSPRVDATALQLGVHTVLRRPFPVHSLIEALSANESGAPPPAPPPPGPTGSDTSATRTRHG